MTGITLKNGGKWLGVTLLIGIGSGSLSAFFLTSLSVVTKVREANSWLILFLPVAGLIVTWLYIRFGGEACHGNNLVIDQANGGSESVPWQMMPLTLFGTISSHLFGGSVGREGTAVQMGGVVAEYVGKLWQITKADRYLLMMCGISGGFSSVFGTPLAGTVFSLEVLAIGKLSTKGLVPSLMTALIANHVTTLWGVRHTRYEMGVVPDTTFRLIFLICLFAIIFGLVSRLFSRSIVWLKEIYLIFIPNPLWRVVVGSVMILILVAFFQTSRYLGLSLPLLTDAFNGQQQTFDFINKLVFTVFSLGAGFQGGEVTPLFEIGATLGSSLAQMTALPIGFVAALGFVGVFSGATNTPLACFVMGIELFGSGGAVWFLVVCVISFLFSGQEGIYSAQLKDDKVTNLL
ncbi:chloride channel protein [uncultured Vagococcus sp.]|uniref:chloride channel protein n=1 Tax=uncultured Vagococcus sp. TaxID=189676 RepID=UPI0028D0A28C|nr:chloride channel protein [uncultured Vagococcus sp.]